MGWSQMTTLAIDREHAHATHERWVTRNLSPRYQAMAEADAEYRRRRDALVAGGMPEVRASVTAYEQLDAEGIEYHIESQCGGCRFYINLEANLGRDWGGCTCPASEHDGRLLFEHDGCAAFEAGNEEPTPEYLRWLEAERDSAAREAKNVREELGLPTERPWDEWRAQVDGRLEKLERTG